MKCPYCNKFKGQKYPNCTVREQLIRHIKTSHAVPVPEYLLQAKKEVSE